MFAFLALAPAGAQGGGMGIAAFLPMLAIFVIFYFLIIRPQSKRQKEHDKMLSELTKGDRIVTSGGIHGVIQRVNEKEATLTLKIGDDVKIEIDRSAIARVLEGKGE